MFTRSYLLSKVNNSLPTDLTVMSPMASCLSTVMQNLQPARYATKSSISTGFIQDIDRRGNESRWLVLHMKYQDDGWFQPLFINNRSFLESSNSCSQRLDSSGLKRSVEETLDSAISITIMYRSETIKGASPPSRSTLFPSQLTIATCLTVKTT